jgi:hypothetical protein
MHFSIPKFTVAQYSVILFYKSLVLEFLLGISDTFVCSLSALLVNIALLLDELQLLMLFVGR